MTLYEAGSDPWWCYCASCKTAGDIVNVARNCWKLDSADTQPFQVPGLKVPFGTNKVRNLFQEFWKSCTDGSVYDIDLYRQYDMLDAASHVKDRFFTHVGFTTTSRAKDLVAAASLKCQPFLPRAESRYFAVMRLFDLPGRTRGFLLRRGDQTYRLVPMLDEFPGSLFGNVVDRQAELIVCDSPSRVARFYARAARESVLCPVVGLFNRPEPRMVAPSLPGKVICWSPEDPVRAIHMARHLGGKVSLAVDEVIKNYTLLHQLAVIKQQPLSWQEAVYRVIAKEHEGVIARMLADMDWSPAERRLFVNEAPEYVREAISRYEIPSQITTTKINSTIVVEMADGWYTKSGERISEFIVRLDHIVHNAAGKAEYRSRILFNDQEYQCTIPAQVVNTCLLSWVHEWLRDVPRVGAAKINSDWDKFAGRVAMLFHKPAALNIPKLGWDQTDQAFTTATYRISSRGDVVDLPVHHQVVRELPKPGRLGAARIERLSGNSPRISLLWAAMAAAGANLVAKAVGAPRPGLLLIGEASWEPLAEVFNSLGCPSLGTITDRSRLPAWQIKENYADQSEWPCLLRTTWTRRWRQRLHEWTANDVESLVCQVDPEMAVHLLLRDQWLAICPGENIGFSKEMREDVAVAFVGWLADLCERRMCLAKLGNYAASVVDDIADWFRKSGGKAASVTAAKTWLLSQEHAHEIVLRHIAWLRRTGKVISATPPASSAIVPGPDGVWIPESLLARIFAEARMPIDIDRTRLNAIAVESGQVVLRTMSSQPGWFVPLKAWSLIELSGRAACIKR